MEKIVFNGIVVFFVYSLVYCQPKVELSYNFSKSDKKDILNVLITFENTSKDTFIIPRTDWFTLFVNKNSEAISEYPSRTKRINLLSIVPKGYKINHHLTRFENQIMPSITNKSFALLLPSQKYELILQIKNTKVLRHFKNKSYEVNYRYSYANLNLLIEKNKRIALNSCIRVDREQITNLNFNTAVGTNEIMAIKYKKIFQSNETTYFDENSNELLNDTALLEVFYQFDSIFIIEEIHSSY